MGTSWPDGPNGPTMPELKAVFPEVEVIDRPFVNFWNDTASRSAVEATNRGKLVISGLATEVCAAFPARFLSKDHDGFDNPYAYVMKAVVRNLDKDQIRAVAEYTSTLSE